MKSTISRDKSLLKGRCLNLNDLRIFALVVQLGNFKSVAEFMGTAPSCISRHMTELQWQLDAKLIEANTRSVTITHLGMQVYAHCARMLEAASAACAVIDSMRAGKPKGSFVASPVDTGTLPATPNQVRQIIREELRASHGGNGVTVEASHS